MDKEGKIELAFWHELASQLFELNGLFTSYRLSHVSALRSLYSWRLFDLLMQFRKTGWLKIPIADFYHAVEAPERYRSNSGQLRRAVIEPTVKEIREKDGLDLTWEAIKIGRKVVMLEFRFPKEKEKEAIENTVELPKATPAKPHDRHKKATTTPEYTPNTIEKR
jgi:plasmid replication initiation protein